MPIKNINYHGLGKELLIKAIDNLDNPKAIYKINDDNYLIITEFKDSKGQDIIVPIQIDGKGLYNNVFIDENQIKSVYGKKNLEQIYIKKEGLDFNEGIQYSNIANSSTNSITQNNQSVKDNTGRTLTKAQQDFFKNVSKELKDEKGNLKTYYHGHKEQIG